MSGRLANTRGGPHIKAKVPHRIDEEPSPWETKARFLP